MPKGSAKPAKPPTALIARSSASLRSVIMLKSSMALPQSQATLHCPNKAMLYYIDMTMGKRIKIARERLGLGQQEVGDAIGVSKQSVNQYETKGTAPAPHRIPALRQVLRVTFAWLHAGDGAPPDKDSMEVRMDDLMVANYQKKPSKSA